jgi:hypothetical protein
LHINESKNYGNGLFQMMMKKKNQKNLNQRKRKNDSGIDGTEKL